MIKKDGEKCKGIARIFKFIEHKDLDENLGF